MDKQLKDLLKEAAENKGLSLQRLSQFTEIPDRYIEALFSGSSEKLPAEPYVRGYLLKLGTLLDLNGEELWKRYKKEMSIKTSGAGDKLPENRFAIKPFNKKLLIAVAIALAIILYLIFWTRSLLGKPELTVYSPASDIMLTATATIAIIGKTNPDYILKINGQDITIDSAGNFSETYNLQPGLNVFELSVKKLLGSETKIIKQVVYQE